MTEEIDVWRAAALLVKRYGQDAPVLAAMRADQLAAEGDMEGRAIWLRIIKAIDGLLSQERPEGEPVN
jgi:hypothetical protein